MNFSGALAHINNMGPHQGDSLSRQEAVQICRQVIREGRRAVHSGARPEKPSLQALCIWPEGSQEQPLQQRGSCSVSRFQVAMQVVQQLYSAARREPCMKAPSLHSSTETLQFSILIIKTPSMDNREVSIPTHQPYNYLRPACLCQLPDHTDGPMS